EPYRLATDVWGIGFKTADQIAHSLGIPHDSPQRVKAGLQFALSQATEDGHCYLPETELVTKATGLLGVDAGLAGRCLEERVAVLTGGPGCGKSYTVRAIVALARAKRAKVVLAAPTGRAAKRLSELAGLQAATLHRLLQLRPGGDAAFDRDRPLDADLVVV